MYPRPVLSKPFFSDFEKHSKSNLASPPESLETLMDDATPIASTSSAAFDSSNAMKSTPHSRNVSSVTAPTLRRVSTLAYNTPSMEVRELPRVAQLPSRWLVSVSSPAFVSEEFPSGTIGTSGPAGRELSGHLVPLYHTLFLQLSAIAREFNFPSTAGLCCYVRYTDGAESLAPRVTDDSWTVLWHHYLLPDTHTPPPPAHGLPIAGRIEFDIDMRKAKWYDGWLRRTGRADYETHAQTSQAPHGQYEEYRVEPSAEPHAGPSDHIHLHGWDVPPKRLSLLDKRGVSTLSIRPVTRASSTLDGRTLVPAETEAVDEVQRTRASALRRISAEKASTLVPSDVQDRIRKWRASSAPATPVAPQMASEPYMESEAVHVRQMADYVYPAPPEDYDEQYTQEMDLDEFTWSISSAGPPESYGPLAPSTAPLPSVHILHRMQGSVIMTASIATSFGPPDEWPETPASAPRLPSPDIAARTIENSPCSASTATSWGAPLSYPSTPASQFHVETPDLGRRMLDDVPCTPSTATTWGPQSYAFSPITPQIVITPDIGERAMSPTLARRHGWDLVWPYQLMLHSPNRMGPFSWPYLADSPRASSEPSMSQHYPIIEPYPAVYPHFNLYPSTTNVALEQVGPRGSANWPLVWPFVQRSSGGVIRAPHSGSQPKSTAQLPWPPAKDPYVGGWPYTQGRKTMSVGELRYPAFSIYASVYPYFNLYPAIQQSSGPPPRVVQPDQYPFFNLYPAKVPSPAPSHRNSIRSVWPRAVDPFMRGWPYTEGRKSISSVRELRYPVLLIYPPVYPCFDLYPRIQLSGLSPKDIHRDHYPFFDLYPASTKAPNNHLTRSSNEIASATGSRDYHSFERYITTYPDFDLYSSILHSLNRAPIEPKSAMQISAGGVYPHFDLYPAVYPHFVLYPPTIRSASSKIQKSGTPQEHYPFINLYPAVYPHLVIYHPQPVAQTSRTPVEPKSMLVSLSMDHEYPVLVIYPAVYPHFGLYPAARRSSSIMPDASFSRQEHYPFFSIYPPLYPHILVYLPHPNRRLVSKTQRVESLPVLAMGLAYPMLVIYPPVYPHFDLYPIANHPAPARPRITFSRQDHYPFFDIYPAIYPHLVIYHPAPTVGSPARQMAEQRAITVTLGPSRYPALVIYPAVYPHFELYSAVGPTTQSNNHPHSSGRARNGRSKHVTPGRTVSPVHVSNHHRVTSPLRQSGKRASQRDEVPPVPTIPATYLATARRRSQSDDHSHVAISMTLPNAYPIIQCYPEVYPNIVIYRDVPMTRRNRMFGVSSRQRAKYTHAQLHMMVFPHGEARKTRHSHLELHNVVFGFDAAAKVKVAVIPRDSLPAMRRGRSDSIRQPIQERHVPTPTAFDRRPSGLKSEGIADGLLPRSQVVAPSGISGRVRDVISTVQRPDGTPAAAVETNSPATSPQRLPAKLDWSKYHFA